MSLPTFDTPTFGLPNFEGYSFQQNSRFRRVPILDGQPRFRLTSPGATLQVGMSWTMDDETLGRFRYWIENDLVQGSLWFLMDAMLGTGQSGGQTDATTLRTYECHFMAEPQATVVGYNEWRVTAQIELRWSDQYPIAPPEPGLQRLSSYDDVTSDFPASGHLLQHSGIQWLNNAIFSQTDGYMITVEETTFTQIPASIDPFEVIDLAADCDSGQATVTALIDGTPIDGLESLTVTSAGILAAASSSNDLAVGQDLQFRIDNSVGAVFLRWRFKLRRT